MTKHQDFDLLGTWEKCALKWQEQGLNQEQVFQMLIDAEAIPANKIFNSDYPVLPHALFPENEVENFLMYNPRGEEPLYVELFNNFFPHEVKWLYREEDIKNIPSDQLIHFNYVNPELEWQSTRNFYFRCDVQYYHFFIYNFMGSEWINNLSIMAVFQQILKHFNINKVVYSLGDNNSWGGNEIYFSAHPEKFEKLNQILQTPCENIAIFFTPEAKTLEFLNIKMQYKQIIANRGFTSALNQNFVTVPETQSETSREAKEWLINMIDEMRGQALQHLKQTDFSQKAIKIRNLFISLAWNTIYDICVANELKGRFPLWQSNRYQDDILDQQQQIALLDDIFNPEDLAKHLTYPY